MEKITRSQLISGWFSCAAKQNSAQGIAKLCAFQLMMKHYQEFMMNFDSLLVQFRSRCVRCQVVEILSASR